MPENALRLVVRVVLSLGLMSVGLFILVTSDGISGELDKAALSWVSLITGYWLR